jgi:acetoin utilization protein AcuB
MSFLIAFNGQFAPLAPSPVSTGITPVRPLTSLTEVHEFREVLEDATHQDHPKKPNPKLEIYKVAEKKFEEQRKRLYAKDIMSFPVKYISHISPAHEAQAMLDKFRFRHLPVVNDNLTIIGMIADRELVGTLGNKSCAEVMVNKVVVCDEHASIHEIAMILLKEKINALPIINHKHELIGIITLSDILKFVIESTMFLNRG